MFRTNMSPSIPWGPYLVWAQWEFWMVHHCPLGPENYIYVYEVNFLMISFIKYSTYYIELIITNIKWNAALIGLLCVRVENFQSIILIQSDGQPDILLSSQWRNREECIKYKYIYPSLWEKKTRWDQSSTYSLVHLVRPKMEELISQTLLGLFKIRLLFQDRVRSQNLRN